jgi:hypothetical protein
MAELAGDLRLVQEAGGELLVSGVLGLQDLERDLALVPVSARGEDPGEAAAADQPTGGIGADTVFGQGRGIVGQKGPP